MVKVAGQALAAVTTAGVGAYLGGAEGTVSGAAIASVVTTVGDVFYQRSLARTRDQIRSRLPARRSDGDASSRTPGPPEATAVAPRPAPPSAAPTAVVPAPAAPTAALGTDPRRPPEPDESPTRVLPAAEPPTELATRAVAADAPTEVAETPPSTRRSPWKRYGVLAATALLVFLVALVVITGIERVKGSPLSGGGPGTSVGSVLGHPTPVSASTAPPSDEQQPTDTTSPTATTTARQAPGDGATREAPTTTSRERATTTTTGRGGGIGNLVPGGVLPGN